MSPSKPTPLSDPILPFLTIQVLSVWPPGPYRPESGSEGKSPVGTEETDGVLSVGGRVRRRGEGKGVGIKGTGSSRQQKRVETKFSTGRFTGRTRSKTERRCAVTSFKVFGLGWWGSNVGRPDTDSRDEDRRQRLEGCPVAVPRSGVEGRVH